MTHFTHLTALWLALTLLAAASCTNASPSGASDAPVIVDRNNSGDGGAPMDMLDQGQPRDRAPTAPDARMQDAAPDAGTEEATRVELKDGEIFVDGAPFVIRGINWNPVPRGQTQSQGVDFAGAIAQDAALMRQAGINTVRTFRPIRDRAVLDTLLDHDIRVVMTLYAAEGDPIDAVAQDVAALRDHPAIIMWLVGNEWNYNTLYANLTFEEARDRVAQVARIIQREDATRPIGTVYGELPDEELIENLAIFDVWGINAYRGISFYDLFEQWSARTAKPMFLSEFGADAYNAKIDAPDEQAQARATRALVEEIEANTTASGDGPALGGTIFEWNDEWWKDQGGDPAVQDTGGIAPGGGPYPDQTFNEEWWGIVDIERRPRLAYDVLQDLWANTPE